MSQSPKLEPDRFERLRDHLKTLHEISERLCQNKIRLQTEKNRLHQLNQMVEGEEAHEWYLQEMGIIVREMEQNRRSYTELLDKLQHLASSEDLHQK